MVNYHDPVVVAQDYLTVSKLWHAVAGLYFWEFVTTLDYEWSFFRKHRPFRWTIWIYFTTCMATLLTVVLSLVDMNVTARYNCKVETFFELTFGFLAATAASLLIVLRMYVPFKFSDPISFGTHGHRQPRHWNMKKLVIAMATGAWGTGVIFQIQTIVRTRVESTPGKSTCVVANPHNLKLNALVILLVDVILLLIMLFGLIRLRFHKSSALGMGRLLWRQSLVWLLAAIIAHVVPVVFICLDLNFPLDEMCLTPSIVVLTIAATRIHRGLVDYASVECTEQLFDSSRSNANGRAEWKANRVPVMRTQLSRMEVAIPEMCEQDETPQVSQHGSAGSLIDVEGQLFERPAELPRPDENVENGEGSPTESPLA